MEAISFANWKYVQHISSPYQPLTIFLKMELYSTMDESSQALWGYKHLSEVERARKKILDKRQMQMNYRSNTHRLYEELGKSMAKTCSDLTRYQKEYQGSNTQGSIHPHELIGTNLEIKSGRALLGRAMLMLILMLDLSIWRCN